MANDINIILKAMLEKQSLSNIKSDINKLQKEINKEGISLNVNINTEDIKSLTTQIENVQKILSKSQQKLKLFDGEQLKKDGIEVYKTLDDVVKKYESLGKITLPSKTLDPITNDLKGFTLQIEKADGVVEKLKFNIANISSGKNINSAFMLDGLQQIDKTASIAEKQLQQTQATKIKLANDEIRMIDKIESIRIKSIERRKQEERSLEEAQNRAVNKTIEDNAKLLQKEELRVKRLGELQGRITNVNFSDNNAIKDYVLSLQEAGNQVTKFERVLDGQGRAQIRMNLTTQQGKDMVKQQSMVIDENTQSLYRQSEALKPNINRMLGFVEQMGIAITRSIQWGVSMGILYGNLRKIREGISFIRELDKELNQVSIIQGATKDQTLELAKSYGNLAVEMGKTVAEISKVNTELIRQGLSMEESKQRLDTILKLSATGAITASQSLEIITSSVNALGEESERTADIMLKSSQISASSVEQIGEAFTKTASSAKSTGMNLEELSAIISGLVEITQESPSSLGNSVKTLLARFNKINEETGEVNENLNEVQKAFESVGVAFLDSENQIRPVYSLLESLSEVWGDLDKNTKMYVATQAAGVRQQNRFLAIMDNFGRVQEINNELMEAGGTLTESYATYLTSVEAAANRATASFEKMWINALNSDAIRMFYNMSSSVTEFIDKIGLLKVATFALSNILLLSNKNFRAFAFSIDLAKIKSIAFSDSLKFLGNIFTVVITREMTLRGALTALNLKFNLAKLGAMALGSAMTLGLSVAITLAVQGITKLIGKTQELKRTNEEAIQSFNQNVEQNTNNAKRLNELASQYDSIREKIEKQITLNDEEKSTLEEIIRISPSVVKGYDERGQAIVDTTKNVQDLIKELELANQMEDIKLKSKGKDFLKETVKDAKSAQNEIGKLSRQIKEIDEGKFRHTVGTRGASSTQVNQGLNDLIKEYEEVIELYGEEHPRAKELSEEIKKLTAQRKMLTDQMSIEKRMYDESSTQTKNALHAVARQSDGYKELTSEMKKFVAEYVKSYDVLSGEKFIDMTVAVETFIKTLSGLNDKDNKKVKILKDDYSSLTDQFKEGKISAEEFDQAVKEIVESILEATGIREDILTRLFPNSSQIQESKQNIQSYVDVVKFLADTTETVNKTTTDYISSIDTLTSAYDKLSKGEELSSKNLADLIIKYPQVAEYIAKTNDLTLDRGKILEIVAKAEHEKIRADLEAKRHQVQVEKALLQARLIQEKAYLRDSYQYIGEYYARLGGGEFWKGNESIDEFNKALSGIDAQIKALGLTKPFEFKLEDKTKSTTGTNKEFSQSLDLIKTKISNVNQELTVLQQKLDDAITIDERQNILDKMIVAQEKKANILKGAIDYYQSQLNKEIQSLSPELRAKVVMGDFSVIDIKDEKIANSIKAVQDFQSTINGLENDLSNVDNTIRGLESNQASLIFEELDNAIEPLNKKLADLDYQMKMLDSNDTSGRVKLIADKMAILKEKTDLATAEFQRLNSVTPDNIKNTNDFKQKIDELTKSLADSQLEMKGLNDELENTVKQLQRSILEGEKRNIELYFEIQENKLKEDLDEIKSRYDKLIIPIEVEIKNLENEIKAIEESEKLRAENEERSKRINEIRETENKLYYMQQITLGNLTDEMAKQVGLEKEKEEYQSRQVKLQELQLRLQNLQNEKNIQQLKKMEDGSFDFEYVADQDAIDKTLKEIKDSQSDMDKWQKDNTDKLYEDLISKRQSYDEWERQNAIRRHLDMLRETVRQKQDKINALKEEFEEEKREREKKLADEKQQAMNHFRDMEILTEEHLAKLKEEYKNNWDAISNNLIATFEGIKSQYQSLYKTLSTPLPSIKMPTVSGGGSQTTGSQATSSKNWSDMYMSARENGDYSAMEYANRQANIERGLGDVVTADKDIEFIKKKITTKHDGGIVGDGSRDLPDMVNKFFNTKPNEQIVKALKGELFIPQQNIFKNFVPNMQNLLSSMPKIVPMGSQQKSENHYHIVANFPNANDVTTIKTALLSFNRLATQD